MADSIPYRIPRIGHFPFGAASALKLLRLVSALHLIAGAAKSQAQDSGPLQTFTAPDGTFSFRYPSLLIHCQQKAQGYSWTPAETCAAYHPVCDEEASQESTAIACFAYPRNKFTNTGAFEAATFSVEIVNQAVTEKDCLSGPADQIFIPRPHLTIHGVSFAVFEFGEGGMNQSVGGHMYRTFHRGTCYQMGINVATASAQVFDPPERELTKADWAEVNGRLQQARDSFRFLK
ncbi:MAG: hypothetical protein ACLPHP_15910 [Candidatus Sulfotelmatobacter sp.]